MIKSQFRDFEGAKARGFSHSDFGLVVQPLDDNAGERLAGAEIVEQEFAKRAQGAGEFLQWIDARAQHLGAPLVQELAGPGRGSLMTLAILPLPSLVAPWHKEQ